MYAYLHDIPVIGIEKYKPLRFNYIDRDVDLSPLGLVNESVVLKTIDSRPDYLVGMEEIKLWHILKIHLSYAGLLPCFGMYSSIDIINDNKISLVIKNRSIEVNSDNFVFYDNFSLPLYEVNDYIDINKNSNVPIDFHDNMEIDWPYFKEMVFYPSERIPGNHINKKDVCAKSLLTDEKLESFEYSELSSRLKVEHFLYNTLGLSTSLSLNKREISPSFESLYNLREILNNEMAYDVEKITLIKYYKDWRDMKSLKV